MAKNGKETRLETPKPAARLPKISNTAKNTTGMKIWRVQMYARAHSMPRLVS